NSASAAALCDAPCAYAGLSMKQGASMHASSAALAPMVLIAFMARFSRIQRMFGMSLSGDALAVGLDGFCGVGAMVGLCGRGVAWSGVSWGAGEATDASSRIGAGGTWISTWCAGSGGAATGDAADETAEP